MMHPTAEEIVPMFSPMLLGEPVPVNGKLKVADTPGFGVELNPELKKHRPYTH
jgi:L-rhamnonate dehydratase